MFSDNEIYENRLKVIAFLKQPKLNQAHGLLDNGYGRCCLGHMCHVLDIESKPSVNGVLYGRNENGTNAPTELIELVGLHNKIGAPKNYWFLNIGGETRCSLASHNDAGTTLKQIADYLESVIMGGENTPWKAINPK